MVMSDPIYNYKKIYIQENKNKIKTTMINKEITPANLLIGYFKIK